MKTLIRTIHPEVRIIDEAKGIVDYVASDETVDSYREVIRAAGWKFDLFRRNAPLVDSHDYSRIEKLLGKVIDFGVEKGKLRNRAQFAIDVPENELARIAWGMVSKDYLRACSVGFFPLKQVSRYDADPLAFNEQRASLKEDDQEKVRTIYLEQQQIELSVCILGANPNALVKAFRDQVVSEENLHALGFRSDEEKDFLLNAGEEYEGSPLWARTLIEKHLGQITGKAFPKKQSKTASPQAPAGADEALRQERTAFLRDLRDAALTS